MPKTVIDYTNTELYKIICDDTDEIYVGHTTNFIKRQIQHKANSKTNEYKLYKTIREYGGWDNWRMLFIEKHPCENRRQAEKREEEIRQELEAVLNSQRCFRPNNGFCCSEGCKSRAISKTDFCVFHGGGNRCKTRDCQSSATGKSDFCIFHGGGNRCQKLDCKSSARGKTDFCINHGGGNRCQKLDCKSSARGKTDFCINHGGGERCQKPDCLSSAQGKTGFCVRHGGGKRCKDPDCETSAQGKTDFCVKHNPKHTCLTCNITISILSVKAHEKTKTHLAKL